MGLTRDRRRRTCLSTVHSRPGAKGHPLVVTHAWRERPAALSCPMPPSGRFPAQRHFRDDAPFQQFERGGEVQLYMRIGIQPGQLMVDPARWPASFLRRCRRSSWGPRSDVVAVHAAGPLVTGLPGGAATVGAPRPIRTPPPGSRTWQAQCPAGASGRTRTGRSAALRSPRRWSAAGRFPRGPPVRLPGQRTPGC